MPQLIIKVKNKIAKPLNNLIVCGNSDYTVKFTFDKEWDSHLVKTARFIWNNQYQDIVFSGDTCSMPVIENATTLGIGVYAGSLSTTTPAIITCTKSVLCGLGCPSDPSEDVYNQIIKLLNEDITTINKRIDNLVKLEEGSTTGDAELIDIRLGEDEKIYDTAGVAVRTQFKNIKNSINPLYDFINLFASPVEQQHWVNCGVTTSTGVIKENTMRKFDRWMKSFKKGTFIVLNDENYMFKIITGEVHSNEVQNCKDVSGWVNCYYLNSDLSQVTFMIKEVNDADISECDATDFIKYIYLPSMNIHSSIEHFKLSVGGIKFEDGTITNSANRVRSNAFRSSNEIKIEVLPPYELSVFRYNLDTFEERINETWCNSITLKPVDISNYRISFKNKYSDSISISDVMQKLRIINNETGAIYRIETEKGVDNFPLIYEFTPFATDYSTELATPKVYNMTSDEFLNTFYNKYLGYNEGMFVGKRVIGKDESNTYDIWEYEFKPENYKKTILLSSGMHTYELPAMFGVARWIESYMTSTDEVFKWLRENVRIVIIPVINPWGFNQSPKTYGNVNGVNPNRNFNDWNNAWEEFPIYTPEENEWNVKGEEPFSEAETTVLKEWLAHHKNAEFWIDNHIGLNNSRQNYGDVWCLYTSTNPNVAKIRYAIDELKKHISTKYNVEATEYVQVDTDSFIKGKFGTNVMGIPTMTIEQAQSTDTSYPTVPNNTATAICEYATQLHAYILAQLY